MLGTRTAAAVRDAAEDLSTLRDDAHATLLEVKTAAQTGSIAFVLVGIVAVVGLAVACVALLRTAGDRG